MLATAPRPILLETNDPSTATIKLTGLWQDTVIFLCGNRISMRLFDSCTQITVVPDLTVTSAGTIPILYPMRTIWLPAIFFSGNIFCSSAPAPLADIPPARQSHNRANHACSFLRTVFTPFQIKCVLIISVLLNTRKR